MHEDHQARRRAGSAQFVITAEMMKRSGFLVAE
jgi:hypothetical protein